jgi:hypothetical protein
MGYQPSTFHYEVDHTTGLRRYDDQILQNTYLNLRIVSELVYNLQTRARIDILDAQNNIGAKAVHDQTPQILGMFASKIFEGLSIFFTAGTGPAIASMLIGRILSGVITVMVKESDPSDDIQRKANEIRDGIDAILEELKHRIDSMIVDMEGQWNHVYHCEGYIDPSLKGDVNLSDFAEHCDSIFPDRDTPEYDDMSVFLERRCRTIIVSNLISAKWRIKKWPVYQFKDFYTKAGSNERHYDFDHMIYNPHTDMDYWCQRFDPLPGLGSKYEIESKDGHLNFMKWLYNMCNSPGRREQYSSYHVESEDREFVDGDRHYVGATIHNMILVDSNGDYAPESLGDWLFIDDSFGTVLNKRGIATRREVYHDWGF